MYTTMYVECERRFKITGGALIFYWISTWPYIYLERAIKRFDGWFFLKLEGVKSILKYVPHF